MTTFYKWLKNQSYRDDRVGDLSKDVSRDGEIDNLRKGKEVLRQHIHFKSSRGDSHENVMESFDQAWGEYKDYKKTL